MRLSKTVLFTLVVASALSILANVPAVLMDPLLTAIAQIRVNAAVTNQSESAQSQSTGTEVTSEKKISQ